MARLFNSITDTIGNTPLIRLNKVPQKHGALADIYIKAEFFNPLSSVKDRIALSMIESAEKEGKIKPGTVLIEPTSGNTGIGLAFVAAAKGYPLVLTMPDSMSIERRKILKVLGARVVLTPAEKGMKGAIAEAEALQAKIPGSFIPQQFDNPANPAVHERTTAEELWNDTDGKIDILVSGIGTGGTLTGVATVIKKRKPSFRAVAVEPETSAVLSGEAPGKHRIQGIGAGFVPKVLNTALIDEVVKVPEPETMETAHALSKTEGIPSGISTGAIVWAAIQLAKRPENKGKMIVAIAPSCAERYLSSWLFADISAESDSVDDLMAK